MKHIAYRLLGTAVAALVAALAACGTTGTPVPSGSASGSHTAAGPVASGLENKTGAEVAQAASAALKAVKTFRVRGTFRSDQGTEKFDLRFEGSSVSGTFTIRGVPIRAIVVGGTGYLNADKRGWQAMGNPDTSGMPVNKWVKVGSSAQQLTPFSRATLVSELTAAEFMHNGTRAVTQAASAGQKVVVVAYADGSRLYVANVGASYPLRLDDTSTAGQRAYSDYGAAFRITAPPNPVSM